MGTKSFRNHFTLCNSNDENTPHETDTVISSETTKITSNPYIFHQNSNNLNIKPWSFSNDNSTVHLPHSPRSIAKGNLHVVVTLQSRVKAYIYRGKFKAQIKPSWQESSYTYINSVIQKYTKINTKLADNLYTPFTNLASTTDKTKPQSIRTVYTTGFISSNILYGTTIYIGEVSLNNTLYGFGTLYIIDGSKYIGEWKNNEFTGFGRFVDSEGDWLEGTFLNGKWNGKGIHYKLNGYKYIGDFVNSCKQGSGKESSKDSEYIGEYRNDKMEGSGVYVKIFKNEKYEGQFFEGMMDGVGIYTWKNGDEYHGQFKKGKMHGLGKYMWSNGDEYYGEYVNGWKHGAGEIRKVNGKVWKGNFVNGKKQTV